MNELHAIIFDLDGTLIDSAPDLAQALNLMLKDYGRRALPLNEVKSMTGDGMLPMMMRAFAATGKPITHEESYVCFQNFIAIRTWSRH
jgi:phosphoglycolate phosphatase